MFLQIPVKLERYINEIKKNAVRFKGASQISLLPIGKTKNGETYKLMFMIYNPYQEAIRITPNFFLSANKIYKMYPSEFELGADTVSAFVLFLTEDVKVHINELELISNIKGEINSLLENSKYMESETKQVEIHQVLKIDPLEVDVDHTISLDAINLNNFEVETVDFKTSDNEFINTELIKIIKEEKSNALELSVANNCSEYNFKIKGVSLKLDDGEHKLHVTADEALVLKAQSKKNIRIYVNKIEFGLLNQEKMKIKVTIL